MIHELVKGLNIDIVNVGMIGTNCYVVYGESKEAIIIDAGDDADVIIASIEELGVKPVAILLTHGHFDHILAVNEVATNYNIPVYAGANEERLLKDAFYNGSSRYRRDCVVENYELLENNKVINIAGIDIKVIFTPGHTEGSVCYYIKESQVLFTGDTLFRESIGRTDLATGDEDAILESLSMLMAFEDNVKVYPGHSESSTIGYERLNNPYVR